MSEELELTAPSRLPPPLTVSDHDVAMAAHELGMTRLGPSAVTSLRTLGIGMEGAGVVRVQHGTVLMMNNELLALLPKLQKRFDALEKNDSEAACKIGAVMATISRALSGALKVAGSVAENAQGASEELERVKRRSFLPCAILQTNNYYGHEKLVALDEKVSKVDGL